MRLAAGPVPVSSSSDSLTTPPSRSLAAGARAVGLRSTAVLPTCWMPSREAIGRPADARAPSASRCWSRPGLQPRRRRCRAAVPGRTTMRAEDLSGDDAAVYRAVAEVEVGAGAAHLQDIARAAG